MKWSYLAYFVEFYEVVLAFLVTYTHFTCDLQTVLFSYDNFRFDSNIPLRVSYLEAIRIVKLACLAGGKQNFYEFIMAFFFMGTLFYSAFMVLGFLFDI